MKGIYLCAYKAYHSNYDLDYNDIKKTSEHINVISDMLEVNLDQYDYIIATPPCNYWSRANNKREISEYAQMTKHLLPGIIRKLEAQNMPYIIENVINRKLFNEHKLYDGNFYVYEHGRHTYWTNIPFNMSIITQSNKEFDYRPLKSGKNKGKLAPWSNSKNRQGGDNVHNVIEYWLKVIHERG